MISSAGAHRDHVAALGRWANDELRPGFKRPAALVHVDVPVADPGDAAAMAADVVHDGLDDVGLRASATN
jgi:hypothetical protein